MTYGEIMNLYSNLQNIKNYKLPIKMSILISRNISILEPIVKVFQEKNTELVNKYCKLKADGAPDVTTLDDGSTRLEFNSDEDMGNYAMDFAELLRIKEDVELIKMGVEELDKLEDSRYDVLTASQISDLQSIIDM